MSKFWNVLKFELKDYISSKGFVIFTVVLAILGFLVLFIPRVIDMSSFTGVQVIEKNQEDIRESEEQASEEQDVMLYVDENGYIPESVITENYAWMNLKKADSVQALKDAVENQEATAGFVVNSATEFDTYLYNKELIDHNADNFILLMQQAYRVNYCAEKGIDLAEMDMIYNVPVTSNENILNKDTSSSYWYCYFLVIIVFMLIVFYGQMIAVSVTNEKSNRAIEVLVTSTTSNSLLFGKVIAGAIGGLCQAGVILGSVLISYRINREQWGGMLDMVLNIPGNVLLAFAFFGLGGYLFYAFLYGAMGALVSKTEDVSKSSGGLMVIIMVVYFFSLGQLTNIDGTVMKVLSFLPFSSYSSMFVRIAMGTVSIGEIIVSFLILVASVIGAGMLGAKIYRMGTLRYGNPIKFSSALREITRNKE